MKKTAMKHARGLTTLAGATLLLALASTPAMARDKSPPAQESQYPDATRKAPKNDLTPKDQKKLQSALDELNAKDTAKAQTDLQALIDESKSEYAQAMAMRGLAVIKFNAGDYKGAIALIQQALQKNSLPNDDYFAVEYMLALGQQADKQYQASLDTIAKWRADGKKETAESYALEGNDYYQLGKYPAAIAAVKKAQSMTDKPDPQWNQILVASYSASGQSDQAAQLAEKTAAVNPDDPDALNNAIAILMQAQKYPEAIQLMEKARAKGVLKSEDGYVNLAKLYFNQAQAEDNPQVDAEKAISTLNEGMSKGVVTASADNYLLLGEAQNLAGKSGDASNSFNKAMPLAKDGEVALQIANMDLTDSKYGESRSMAKMALQKGVKRKGIAYLILAGSERGLKNKSAQVAALKLAAQEPESAAQAKAELKNLGAG
jgi:tetratricopeptide (TPR) repeat protein